MASGKIDSGHRHELHYLCPCSRGQDVDERGSLFFFLLFPFSPVRDDDEESTTTIIIISIIVSIRNGVAIGKTAARARRDD